jgi:hypothetical protein
MQSIILAAVALMMPLVGGLMLLSLIRRQREG